MASLTVPGYRTGQDGVALESTVEHFAHSRARTPPKMFLTRNLRGNLVRSV